MNKGLARLATRMYPRRWRERYAEEFEALLINEQSSVRAFLDVTRSAVSEHLFPAVTSAEDPCHASFASIMKKPSALFPMAMSLAALGVVFAQIAVVGIARQADVGAAAHSWQLLMATQLPILLYFAVKWLPRAPKQTLGVIALQVMAIAAAMAPVFFLRW